MRRSTDAKGRKVTPPSPSYMSKNQFATYLADLRTHRAARPGGARPQPTHPNRVSTGRLSLDASSPQAAGRHGHQRTPSQAPSTAAASVSSRYSTVTGRDRDYYPTKPTVPLKPSDVVPTATYMERSQRWMEKEEAVSLREAMEEMHIRKGLAEEPSDDESRIYNAALDEAAEFVWQHQHGPGGIPRPDGPYRYRPHLRKNSYAHARTASIGAYRDDIAPSGLGRDVGSRSASASSADSNGSRPSIELGQPMTAAADPGKKAKPYGTMAGASNRRSSLRRDVSGEIERPFSGDQIWEEPEASSAASNASLSGRASPDKLNSKHRHATNRVRLGPWRDGANPPQKPLDRVKIHHNPPSQSRDPQHTTNAPSPRETPDPSVERKSGMEVRSQDIRAATRRRLQDRSSKLPEPTAVSDSPGWPIVSFDANWSAPDESADVNPDRPPRISTYCGGGGGGGGGGGQAKHQYVDRPRITVAEGDGQPWPWPSHPQQTPCAHVPSIAVAGPDDGPRSLGDAARGVPTIAVDEAPARGSRGGGAVPSIVATPNNQPALRRPLPSPGAADARPSRAQRPRGHWSPAPGAVGRAAATACHECGLPIQGRFVALAGSPGRFHPQCFSCFTCGTSLEAMEISPEPAHVRTERLERIRRRAAGEALEELPGKTAADDGDERLRFFCHLDWHELFAPRCKHYQTPILGEHVVALGAHWHHGHFFCAECGDPFGHDTTHIEKDGYAWCVGCQTKRTERRAPKCRQCKTAVIGHYIQALGGEWHEHCFRCAECHGAFDDGQIFPKEAAGGGLVVLCTACRTRELKS